MTRAANPSLTIDSSVTIITLSKPSISLKYLIAFGSKYILGGILYHCKLLFLRPINFIFRRFTALTFPETEFPPKLPHPNVSDGMNALYTSPIPPNEDGEFQIIRQALTTLPNSSATSAV